MPTIRKSPDLPSSACAIVSGRPFKAGSRAGEGADGLNLERFCWFQAVIGFGKKNPPRGFGAGFARGEGTFCLRACPEITLIICLGLLPRRFVARSSQIQRICSSLAPRCAAKSRRHLFKVISGQALRERFIFFGDSAVEPGRTARFGQAAELAANSASGTSRLAGLSGMLGLGGQADAPSGRRPMPI